MWANDTNYTVIKNGVVVVSGTGPAIRVDGNQLVIRDGPKETPPLALRRAEAARKLRHIIVTGHAGGFVTFDALRWLSDTGVAFSQIDWNGNLIFASGPRRRPGRPALRRAQVLICSGVMPETAVAIAREILCVKLVGEAEVARLMGWTEASSAIDGLAADIAGEAAGPKVLAIEAKAALIYWREWATVPVRFARDNPQRLDHKGRWRPGRAEAWNTFGIRGSMLTAAPWRATTPANAVLNFLFGVAKAEMTVALHATGLDEGIGLFHADHHDGRPSLALDALEAVRPCIEAWFRAFLAATAFANRDFHETAEGEVRLAHPLAAHLAHTAALWRPACERVAEWMARAFGGAVELPTGKADATDHLPQIAPAIMGPRTRAGRKLAPLPHLAPAFAVRDTRALPVLLRGGLRDDPVPRACFECGRALTRKQRRFCSPACTAAFADASGRLKVMGVLLSTDAKQRRSETLRGTNAALRDWAADHTADRAALDRWYSAEIEPRLASLRTSDIRRSLAVSPKYAALIKQGQRTPHPRHFEALAMLAGVAPPAIGVADSG
jgi:CRISP-associated protein Cas1